MSDFLLQKSCKLLQESKRIKKSKLEKRLKKKKNLNFKKLEEEFQNNILVNLKKLEQLNQNEEVDVSDKVLPKRRKQSPEETVQEKEEEEGTVFTEKDFEDFEKEYFDS